MKKTKQPINLCDKIWSSLTREQKQKIHRDYEQAITDHETFYDDIWLSGCAWGTMTTLESIFGKHNLIKKI